MFADALGKPFLRSLDMYIVMRFRGKFRVANLQDISRVGLKRAFDSFTPNFMQSTRATPSK